MLLALIGLAAASPLRTEAVTTTLENGLVVIVDPQSRTDEVALYVGYGVGSHDELDGEHGCAHLFEHLMFEGSRHVPENMFDTWLTAAGGNNNAWTSEDQTVYHMTFPSGALDLALFLESDRLAFLDASISERTLENQQDVVQQERDRGYANPHGRDYDALSQLLFPTGHPYHVPVIGTVADLHGFTTSGVFDFWERHYRAANAVVVISGRVSPEHAVARVSHWFEDAPQRGPALPRPVAPTEEPVPASGVVYDAVEDRTLYLAWRAFPATHPDAEALELLAWVLSGGRGTRLDDALYYDKSFATSTFSSVWLSKLDGAFVLGASSPRTPLKRLLAGMEEVVADLAVNPPSEEELSRARQSALAGLANALELPEDRASLLLDCYVRTGDANCVGAQAARFEAVTSADLVRVASTWLVPKHRVTLSVVPHGDKKALTGSLPVEIP